MLIYFAAPLFCDGEQSFNRNLAEKLEEQGYDVFLPQRDGIESKQPGFDQMATDELHQNIFRIDRDKILESDIFLVILDGRVPDEGACVELGIAYTQKFLQNSSKLLIGLHTDKRSAFPDAKLNAMILGALDQIVDNEKTLINAINNFSS